jgi:hypothetical protein
MAYIGRFSNNVAVRQTYFYTATGGETSLSGADDNSNPLVFTDGTYVDVYLNGVLLVKDTDYNVNTANTIAGLSALSASDVVEIVVYDIFSIAGLSSYTKTQKVPFYKSDSTLDTISLTSDDKIPFTKSDGSASNVPLTN